MKAICNMALTCLSTCDIVNHLSTSQPILIGQSTVYTPGFLPHEAYSLIQSNETTSSFLIIVPELLVMILSAPLAEMLLPLSRLLVPNNDHPSALLILLFSTPLYFTLHSTTVQCPPLLSKKSKTKTKKTRLIHLSKVLLLKVRFSWCHHLKNATNKAFFL